MFVIAPILTLFLLIVLFCLMGHFGRARQFWIVGSTLVFGECAYFKFFHSAVLEYDYVIIGAVFLLFWLLTLLAFVVGVQALVRCQFAAGIVPIVLSILYVIILYFVHGTRPNNVLQRTRSSRAGCNPPPADCARPEGLAKLASLALLRVHQEPNLTTEANHTNH